MRPSIIVIAAVLSNVLVVGFGTRLAGYSPFQSPCLEAAMEWKDAELEKVYNWYAPREQVLLDRFAYQQNVCAELAASEIAALAVTLMWETAACDTILVGVVGGLAVTAAAHALWLECISTVTQIYAVAAAVVVGQCVICNNDAADEYTANHTLLYMDYVDATTEVWQAYDQRVADCNNNDP